MRPEAKRSKRDAANERLRVSFLGQAGPKLLELRELVSGTPGADLRDSVAHELVRLGETAGSLGFDQIASVAAYAADELRDGGDAAVLRAVARALRKAQGQPLFGAVVVVASGRLGDRLQAQAEHIVEPLLIVPEVSALLEALHLSAPAAVVVPASALDMARRLADEPFPTFVYGDQNDWDLRLQAVEAGASGFLPGGFTLAMALDLTRERAVQRDQGPVEVFVLAAEGAEREALLEALREGGMSAMASASPAEIAPALDVVTPDALVLGAVDGGADVRVLIRAVRSQDACGGVPILVLADPDGEQEAGALRAAGADDVLSPATPTGEIVARLEARVRRARSICQERDRVTRLPRRPAVLRTLDRHIGHARRRGGTLAVALVQLEGLADLGERWGRAAVNAGQRVLAEQLETRVRRVDVVGQLGPDVFVVGLPGCGETEIRRRMEEIRERFLRRCRGDARLKELTLAVGVADTETTPDRLLQRAEQDLLRARSR